MKKIALASIALNCFFIYQSIQPIVPIDLSKFRKKELQKICEMFQTKAEETKVYKELKSVIKKDPTNIKKAQDLLIELEILAFDSNRIENVAELQEKKDHLIKLAKKHKAGDIAHLLAINKKLFYPRSPENNGESNPDGDSEQTNKQ